MIYVYQVVDFSICNPHMQIKHLKSAKKNHLFTMAIPIHEQKYYLERYILQSFSQNGHN